MIGARFIFFLLLFFSFGAIAHQGEKGTARGDQARQSRDEGGAGKQVLLDLDLTTGEIQLRRNGRP